MIAVSVLVRFVLDGMMFGRDIGTLTFFTACTQVDGLGVLLLERDRLPLGVEATNGSVDEAEEADDVSDTFLDLPGELAIENVAELQTSTLLAADKGYSTKTSNN